MQKFVNKLEDFEVRAKNEKNEFIIADNAMSFTEPDFEPDTQTIEGYAGMAGKIELIDWLNANAPEFAMKFSRLPENSKFIVTPDGCALQVFYTESAVDTEGKQSYDSFKIELRGTAKNLPGGGEKKKGERGEVEIKIACTFYKKEKIGDTTPIIVYDPLNGKIEMFGKNYASSVKSDWNK